MHLKGLELQGFKSFPDKIYIEFENGITAIVGPNGSGKSNIADAVRWVLGEMSTKNLRGSKMEDVIFDGTSSRRRMGYAQVCLIIDNSDSTLPLEFNEVTITRRYYRSGESEYYINKAPCRLRDINELFMDTGLGRDGYSIIGQGKIAEILSSKSEDRRQIFEEAAGISKYRYKKAEAERKLATTEENVLRITDIVAELSTRIEPLRIQSKKAKEYLEYMGQKKQLEIDVWLYNIEKAKKQLLELDILYNASKEELTKAGVDLLLVENEIDSSFESTKDFTVKIDTVRQEIAQMQSEISNFSSQAAVLNNDIEHNNNTISAIKQQLLNQEDLFLDIDNKINEQNAIISTLTIKTTTLSDEMDSIVLEKAALCEKEDEYTSKLTDINNQIVNISNNITDAKIKESSIISSKASLLSQIDTINSDKNSILLQHKTALNEKEICIKNIEENKLKIDSLSNVINGYNLKLTATNNTQNTLKNSLIESEKKLFEAQNRADMLIGMEKQYQGFGESIRYIMNKSGNGELSGIVGTVSSQITVTNEYTLAIETALGASISNIIVKTENDAKSAISHLKSKKIGRATFLPISTIKGTVISKKEYQHCSGFIDIASNLVTSSPEISSIVDSLLGRTIIADHLDNAVIIAKASGFRCKVVTLDGQVINAGGSMTGGSSVKNAGILSRANEIKSLTLRIRSLTANNQEITDKTIPLENEIAKISAQLEIAQNEKTVLNENAVKYTTTFSHFDVLIENLVFTIENTSKQVENLQTNLKKLESSQVENTIHLSEMENSLKSIDLLKTNISKESDEFVINKDATNAKINEINLLIMANEKDIEANENILSSLVSQKKMQTSSNDEKTNEIKLITAKISAIKLKLAENDKFITTSTATIAEKTATIELYIKDRDKSEAHNTKLRTQQKSLSEHKERLMLENERLSTRLSTINNQYDNYIASLFDEYELTVSDAIVLRSSEINITEASKKITEIKAAIKRLGNINVDSIEEFKEVNERYLFLSTQLKDLNGAKDELLKIIVNLTGSMQEIFADQFKIININFSKTFIELFGGGKAELILTDSTNILSSGIEIKVAPPGKIIKNLSALSGGEQAFVAIALYFSILKVRPTPFCILDEIEAALDDVNVVKFAEYLRRLTNKTQFISITHRRGTMEEADRLYGVTMQEKGISKMLTINVNDIVSQIKL